MAPSRDGLECLSAVSDTLLRMFWLQSFVVDRRACHRFLVIIVAGAAALLLADCDRKHAPPVAVPAARTAPVCDPDNGGLKLPPGFCALVVADHFANLHDIVVTAQGDIYGSLLNRRLGFGRLVALRDSDGNGRADQIREFGDRGGVGLALWNNYLYLGADDAVWRYSLRDWIPSSPAEMMVSDLPAGEVHASKTLAFDDSGGLYVSIGAPSNACQQADRSPGSPGLDPCPQLDQRAGIWRFAADQPGQRMGTDGQKYATGIRNALALAWHRQTQALYLVQHGRDELNELWPERFTVEQGDLLPAEEMLKVVPGAQFSWPYCYYDGFQQRRVLAPEYGGDGLRTDRCTAFPAPVVTFPAHYGPNDMVFYQGGQFPARYRGGAFIAFHGAYKQMSSGTAGYQVVFVPLDQGVFSSRWEVFADGFAGQAPANPGEGNAAPEHRPTSVAEGPDGSLYIADSETGRIWRVLYRPAPAAPARTVPNKN